MTEPKSAPGPRTSGAAQKGNGSATLSVSAGNILSNYLTLGAWTVLVWQRPISDLPRLYLPNCRSLDCIGLAAASSLALFSLIFSAFIRLTASQSVPVPVPVPLFWSPLTMGTAQPSLPFMFCCRVLSVQPAENNRVIFLKIYLTRVFYHVLR